MSLNHYESKLSIPVFDDDHSQGDVNAAVTLVEYGDYECPYCGRAYPIVKEIQRRLGPSLRFVFRNFPLAESHRHAQHAAEAAEAAGAQGLFWEMHDKLFERQHALDDQHLVQYANEIGADERRFLEDLRSHRYYDRVRADFLGGIHSGVNGTPTFFINGLRHDDSWDLNSLLSALRAVMPVSDSARTERTHMQSKSPADGRRLR